MAIVATLLERRPSAQQFRRAMGSRGPRILSARTPAHLDQLLLSHLIDTVILSASPARGQVLDALRRQYPTLPLVVYTAVRSDDADLLHRLQRERLVRVMVEGVDEPVMASRVVGHGVMARRLSALLPLGAALDLTDPLQQRAWALIVREAPQGLPTADLAKRLGVSRETLSRRFGAGGGPGLKLALDAVRLFAAGQLLANPALQVADVARLLGFSSLSLLQRTARRTFGVSVREVGLVPEGELVARLTAGGGWR